MDNLTKVERLRRELEAARAELAALAGVGPCPRKDPTGAVEWLADRQDAQSREIEALDRLRCLVPTEATAEDLALACSLVGCDVERSALDLAYWARGSKRLEASQWSIGQRVEVLPPKIMVAGRLIDGLDARAGSIGAIVGMSDDGSTVYLDIFEWRYGEGVCVARIRDARYVRETEKESL